jgi:hypothetical protein
MIRPRASRWNLVAAALLLYLGVGAAAALAQGMTQAVPPYRVGFGVSPPQKISGAAPV